MLVEGYRLSVAVKCPSCGGETQRVALDRYWCVACRKMWLIHRLITYQPPEEDIHGSV